MKILILQGYFNYVTIYNMFNFRNKNIYLDYAAMAPLNRASINAIKHILNNSKNYANSSSIHKMGLNSKKVLEDARSTILKNVGANSGNLIFTSSGTESNAIAIIGTVNLARKNIEKPHIITTTLEHSSVLETCKMLEEYNLAEVSYIKPKDEFGNIDPNEIYENIKSETVIISVNYVNGEVGIVQDISEILKKINKYKEQKYNIKSMRFTSNSYFPYFHVDAAQAYPHFDISLIIKKGVDLVSFNSTKIGGPSGIAALYTRKNINLGKIYSGGSQEMGLKPGTSAFMLAYAFAESSISLEKKINKNEKKHIDLKKYFVAEINKISFPNAKKFIINSGENCIPSIVSVSFPYFSGKQFAVLLDARGIFVSSKSACNLDNGEESKIISELRQKSSNKNEYISYGTVRFSFGENTTKGQIKRVIKEIKHIIQNYKGVLY